MKIQPTFTIDDLARNQRRNGNDMSPWGVTDTTPGISSRDPRITGEDLSQWSVTGNVAPPGVSQFAWDSWTPAQRQQNLNASRWAQNEVNDMATYAGVGRREIMDFQNYGTVPDYTTQTNIELGLSEFAKTRKDSPSGLGRVVDPVMRGVSDVSRNFIAPVGQTIKENPGLLLAAPFAATLATGALAAGGAAAAGKAGSVAAKAASAGSKAGLGTKAAAGAKAAGAASGAATGVASSSPAWFTPAIQGGLTLFGGALASNAASDAVDAQLAGTREGINYLRESRDIALERNEPFYNAAVGAIGSLEQMAGLTDEPYDITQDPSYQFRLQESLDAFENSAFASGGITGGEIEGFLRYAQDYASTEYDASYRRLLQLAGYGDMSPGAGIVQNFGAGAADLALNAGEARGSGYIARNNSWQNSLDQLAQIDWTALRN